MTLFDYWEEATSNHRVGGGGGGRECGESLTSTRSNATSTAVSTTRNVLSTRKHPWPQPKSSSVFSTKNQFQSKEQEQENCENSDPVNNGNSIKKTDIPAGVKKAGIRAVVASTKTMTTGPTTTKPTTLPRRMSSVSKGLTDNKGSTKISKSSTTTTTFMANKYTHSSSIKPSSSVLPVSRNRISSVNFIPTTATTTKAASTVPTITFNAMKIAPKRASLEGSNHAGSGFTPTPVPQPAAYLVYEPDSSGRLVEHYVDSKHTPTSNNNSIVGRWTAGNGKNIATFKLKRNAGRNVLQGQCSAGVQGRRAYCNGWCQFVKSAFIQGSEDVTLWDPTGKGLMVDVYLYYDNDPSNPDHPQTVRLTEGVPTSTTNLRAVAALPKNTPFYERHVRIGLHKWLQDGSNHGYSSMI